MEIGLLPDDGPALVGPVPLPAGRRHYAEDSDELVAWVTEDPMGSSGLAWLALSAMHAQTGLVPVLLQPSRPDPEEDVPSFGFCCPADVALLDQMTAGELLAGLWANKFDRPATGTRRCGWPPSSAPLPTRSTGRRPAPSARSPTAWAARRSGPSGGTRGWPG